MTAALRPASARYWLNRALFDLGQAEYRAAFDADREGYVARYPLDPAARAALLGPDWAGLVAGGALPNLIFKFYILHGHAPETFPQALETGRRG